jgi:hypothetical protein
MRFLMLGFRRFSSADKHRQRPVRIDSFTEARVEMPVNDEDAEIDALLRELGEDPFDVWARLCAPVPSTSERGSSTRPRRLGKRRACSRRRVGVRD